MGVASNLSPETIARWIITELHEDQVSVSRITQVWPPRPPANQAVGPAKVIVVLQTDHAKVAALHFHHNDRFLAYSHEWNGIICLEPRQDSTKASRRYEAPPDWNMEHVWSQYGAEEQARRSKLKVYCRMEAGQPWGQLTDIPKSTFHYDLDER